MRDQDVEKAIVACPQGTQVFGGGARTLVEGGTGFATVALISSYPDEQSNSWVVELRAIVPGALEVKVTVSAYASCAVPPAP
jgi:hypothetical protein